ncbi:response regulator receiver domain [Brevundimonas diminuta]|uniref:Response receiver domain-containing protein n=1 Tax=Brevundimonas diminuta TaxID=293 RepID=A0A1Z3LTK6_BREDI|nr:response regulator receiver domain [Brevundimonas diminuta]ASD25491.1 hypothetical protein CD943_00390 [Brevundimonas diminuta]
MTEVAPALLREAFIDPIRFALLIDDEFRSVDQLLEVNDLKAEDGDRLKGLFSFCREKGWLCDVEGDFKRISTDGVRGLHQSDLLILDFHLDPSKQDDASASINLIQKLEASPHLNLVVVYTAADNIAQVALDIGYGLGGGGKPPAGKWADAKREELDDLADRLGETSPSAGLLSAYISSDPKADSMMKFRERLKDAGANNKSVDGMISIICSDFFAQRISETTLASRPSDTMVTIDIGSEVPWISAGNVFVAVVSKDHGPDQILDKLCLALAAWKPSPLQVMLIHARSAIEKAGAKYDHKVLESPVMQAAWILDVLSTESMGRARRLGDLYGNLFQRLSAELQLSVGEFGRRLFESDPEDKALILARAMSRVDDGIENHAIYHAANEFLCSDRPPESGRLTTGLIFRVAPAKKGGETQLFVCTTPNCDLVAGQNDRGWDAQLNPMKAAYVTRLRPVENDDFVPSLQDATQGRHLYLTVDGRQRVYEFVDQTTRQANLEVIFVGDEGRYSNDGFSGHVVRMAEEGPELQATNFKVLAQLRPHYANKLLMDAGQQKARIGLAWLPMPKLPAPDPEVSEAGEAAPELPAKTA